MGFAVAVGLGTTAPTFVTLGTSATCLKKSEKKVVEWTRGWTEQNKHGQSKIKRWKITITAEGEGGVTANSTEAGTSEATAIIDRLNTGTQKNDSYNRWSVEGHYYTNPP